MRFLGAKNENDDLATQGDLGGGGGGAPIDAWPVGSIFMSVVATDPATLLGGGTWARWGVGRVPVSLDENQAEFNTVEEVGGAKTHTLTETEIPAHAHYMYHSHSASIGTDGAHAHSLAFSSATGSSASNIPRGTTTNLTNFSGPVASNGDHSHTASIGYSQSNTNNTGGNGAHNNLQPYITCYMWKRTA